MSKFSARGSNFVFHNEWLDDLIDLLFQNDREVKISYEVKYPQLNLEFYMKDTYVILEKKFTKSNNLKETNRLNLLTVLNEILPIRLNKLIITNLKPPFK